MSSPLEGRIRTLAREEAAALLGAGPDSPKTAAADRVAVLEKEVAELRARLDTLEKAPGQALQEAPAGTRRTRKTAE